MDAAGDYIDRARAALLRDTDAASVMTEQHYKLALSALEQAASHMRLASYHQAQAIAGRVFR